MHGHSIWYMVCFLATLLLLFFSFHLLTIIQLLLLFGRLLLGLAYGLLALATLSLHILALLLDARLEILQSLLQPMLVIATNAQRFEVLRVERKQSAALHIVLLEDGYIALQLDAHQPVADLQRGRSFSIAFIGVFCASTHLLLGPFVHRSTFVVVASSSCFAIRETGTGAGQIQCATG